MDEFKQKHKHKLTQRIVFSIPVILILVITTPLMTVAVWNIYKKARDTGVNLDNITGVYDELHARESELSASVEGLETAFGIESEIREKYGLVREGEEVVVIIDDEFDEDVVDTEEESWWQKIKNIFK